ncbi:hypothetical protein VNO78_32742 [Psophocarpus tetragonolobus]|uniref:Uncharacterized protein n=1 Tax=Psophocarpus tetragonolobus TaxID=3891 RepID=A0AAN9RQ89_PSOTE
MDSYSHSRNPIATIQLCVDNNCLIFQILHAVFLPRALFTFLARPIATFVGVHISNIISYIHIHLISPRDSGSVLATHIPPFPNSLPVDSLLSLSTSTTTHLRRCHRALRRHCDPATHLRQCKTSR